MRVCVCVCVCVFVSQCQMLLCSPLGRVDQTPFARRLLLAHTTSSVKPEVCSISQHNRWTAPRAYVINARKLIKNGRVVPELCSGTDGHTAGPHTNNHIYRNAVLPYLGSGGGVIVSEIVSTLVRDVVRDAQIRQKPTLLAHFGAIY